MAEKGIEHYVYSDGAIQGLRFRTDGGADRMVGVILAGQEYEYGIAERQVDIQVIIGSLAVNGSDLYEGLSYIIRVGEHIRVRARWNSVFICSYGLPEPRKLVGSGEGGGARPRGWFG